MTHVDLPIQPTAPAPDRLRPLASAGVVLAVVASIPVMYAAWVIFWDGPELFEVTATQMLLGSMTSGVLASTAVGLGLCGVRTWQGWVAIVLGWLVLIACGLGAIAVGGVILVSGLNQGL